MGELTAGSEGLYDARLAELCDLVLAIAQLAQHLFRVRKELMAHETLRTLAKLLVETIRASATIDWTRKEGVRARMRIEVRKLLTRYGYPPDLQKAAVDLVVRQAEAVAADWG